MRLNNLTSTPRTSISDPAGRARAATRLPHAYVAEAEGTEADRERSTRDELDAAQELPPPKDAIPRQQQAEAVATQLRDLGPNALKLLQYQNDETANAPNVHIDARA